MNRLQHFLHAKTQFNLHSPFVYGLYTEVLFSRAEGCPKGRYEAAVWRLEQRYGVAARRHGGPATLDTPDGRFLVVDHPHRTPSPLRGTPPKPGGELDWQHLINSAEWQVTLDFFDYGIAVANARLSKQHFILR